MDQILEYAFYSIPGCNVVSSLTRFYALFWIALYHEFLSKDFGLSLKRVIVLFLLFFCFPLLMIWNHVGFLLDDLLYPDWRACQINKPCFIVGNARSGTTWLHRLVVTSMEDKFTTFKTWEIIFAPSVVWKRLFMTLFNWDAAVCGSLGFHLLCWAEKSLLPASQLHEIGLQLAEEDEWLMIHISFAQLMCFFFPCAGVVLGKLIMFDLPPDTDARKLPHAQREMIFSFYKDCVRRHLFARCELQGRPAGSVVFVSKNPAFTLRLQSLYRAFPDARVVCLLRDPAESVPSMVSYIARVYHAFSAPRIVHPNARDLLSYCISHYQYPLEQLNEERRPAHQWAFVQYRHLQRALVPTLLRLLQRLQVTPPDQEDPAAAGGVHARLAVEQQRTNKFKSTHQHSVESCCGMDADELRRILHVVYETHNFE